VKSLMKRSLLCAVLVLALVLVSVAPAFAAVGSWSTASSSPVHNNVTCTGRSGNYINDLYPYPDPFWKHYVNGYSYTKCTWAAASGKTGAMKPFYLYVKSTVVYVSWHVGVGNVTGTATESHTNSAAYVDSYVRAPANESLVLEGYCYGGIPQYAYTDGVHAFRYNSAATKYTWGTHIQYNKS